MILIKFNNITYSEFLSTMILYKGFLITYLDINSTCIEIIYLNNYKNSVLSRLNQEYKYYNQ